MRHGGRAHAASFGSGHGDRLAPAVLTGAMAVAIACAAPSALSTGAHTTLVPRITASQLGSVTRASDTAPVPQSVSTPPSGTDVNHSPISYGSWGAGYVADAPAGKEFTAVSARFVAPAASAAPRTAGGGWVSIWGGIGLQALNGDQLMQAGISMYATPGGYWEVTAPWWINEPVTPTVPHVMGLRVNPGDTVEIDAGRVDATHWSFRVTDVTTGATATGECSGCQSDGSTAAWVMEDPLSSSGAGQTGFANPGTVQFVSAAASVDSGSLTPLSRLNWHPLLRSDGTTRQGPTETDAPSVIGGFVLGTMQ